MRSREYRVAQASEEEGQPESGRLNFSARFKLNMWEQKLRIFGEHWPAVKPRIPILRATPLR